MAKRLILDFGSRSIKGLVVKKTKNKTHLLDSFAIEIDEEDLYDGEIKNLESIRSKMELTLKEKKIKLKSATLTISSSMVITRTERYPKVKIKDLRDIIIADLPERLPVKTSNFVIDFKIIGELEHGGNSQYQVMLFAVPKNIIQDYLDLMGLLKIKVDRIDYIGNSITKLFIKEIEYATRKSRDRKNSKKDKDLEKDLEKEIENLQEEMEDKKDSKEETQETDISENENNKSNYIDFYKKAFGVIDVGAKKTQLSIASLDGVSFTREIMIGADVFITSLMNIKDLEFDIAENIVKHELNVERSFNEKIITNNIGLSDGINEISNNDEEIIVKLSQDVKNTNSFGENNLSQFYDLEEEIKTDSDMEEREITITKSEINDVIDNSCYSLIEDLSKVLDYFRYENSSFEIVRLYLTGGGSFIKGLKSNLEQSLGFEVIVVEDFRTLQINKKNTELAYNINSYLTAIGASL